MGNMNSKVNSEILCEKRKKVNSKGNSESWQCKRKDDLKVNHAGHGCQCHAKEHDNVS